MLRPSRDYPQFRPGAVPPGAPPPMNGPMGMGMNMPMNAPMNVPMNMPPSYAPAPMGGRGFVRPPVSGGHFAYPPPPPTPVPSPHLGPFLSPLQASPFVPPLPPTPPSEAPPPPPPPPPLMASPSAPSSPPHSILEQLTPVKQAPLGLPAQPPKPHDLEILKNIEGMAEFVVKNGPRYESMARAKHAGDPRFAFLFENSSGPEAVINRDYYRWKKEVLQMQSEAAAESKSSKPLGSDSDLTRSNMTSEEGQQREKVPGSPSVSDMDMEDDLDTPSPRRDSSKLLSVVSAEEPDFPGKASDIKPLGSPDTLEEEVGQPVGKSESLNKGKQAQCRLTGDYTGSLIDNYMSDISEDSEELEPSKDLGMTEGKYENKEESKSIRQESPEPMQLANVSSSEAARHLIVNKVSERKVLEQANEDSCEEQSDVGHVKSFEKGVLESTFKENGFQESRKRSRSCSRSRSKSRSSSHSRSPSRARSRSRSANRSHEDGNKSPSPLRSALHNTLGRSPPEDLSSKDAERGKFELSTRVKRGVKGGANICLNYARGRCFRGDSCRLEHQRSDKGLQGGDRAHELEENETSKLIGSPQELGGKSALEGGNNAGASAEVAAVKKVKHKAGAEKIELSPEGEVAKRLESKGEITMMPGMPSQEDGKVTRSPSVQINGSSPAPEGRAAAHSAHGADLLQSNASHPSEVGVRSPSSTSRQVIGNYGSPGEAFRYQNLGAVQLSGFSQSPRPPILTPTNNTYVNTISEADRTYGNNFPGGPVQLSSSVKMGFQQSSHANPGSIHSTAPVRNLTHEYANHARNYAPSHPPEYGLPLQAQSGTAQNTLVPPPPAYLPMRQQHDFSTDTTRGYTPIQHGYTSPFSLPAQQHQSLHHPPFPGDSSRHSTFPNVANHDPYTTYPKSTYSVSSQSQSYTPWSTLGSSGISSSKVSEVQSVLGKSSSYSYALTTIPPLPSIIELPGATKPSSPGDQYDPLSDSLEPSVGGGSKSTSFSLLKAVEEGKFSGAFASTLASHLENISPGFDAGKGDPAEAAGDPAVGIVENVSPPEDNRDWSPGQPVEAVEEKQGHLHSKNKKNNFRGLKLLRSAVADHVKEVLKPTWKEGRMSKDAFKNIVKKAVDKVTAALPPHHIPKSQEKVDQFMSSSRLKISKLVQGYIDKYQKT